MHYHLLASTQLLVYRYRSTGRALLDSRLSLVRSSYCYSVAAAGSRNRARLHAWRYKLTFNSFTEGHGGNRNGNSLREAFLLYVDSTFSNLLVSLTSLMPL